MTASDAAVLARLAVSLDGDGPAVVTAEPYRPGEEDKAARRGSVAVARFIAGYLAYREARN